MQEAHLENHGVKEPKCSGKGADAVGSTSASHASPKSYSQTDPAFAVLTELPAADGDQAAASSSKDGVEELLKPDAASCLESSQPSTTAEALPESKKV